jgi:hypothetical protein
VARSASSFANREILPEYLAEQDITATDGEKRFVHYIGPIYIKQEEGSAWDCVQRILTYWIRDDLLHYIKVSTKVVLTTSGNVNLSFISIIFM